MEQQAPNFIGRGWKFPVAFDASEGVEMLAGEEQIRNSLDILFATRLGERVMQPNYGSELDTFLFSTASRSTLTYMQAIISDAILYNEPRIILNEVEVEQDTNESGLLIIHIHYTISATNNRYNYVYPFYLKEATNLKP